MRTRRTLLAAASFLLLLLVFLADRRWTARVEDARQEQKRLLLLKEDEITSFTIENLAGTMSFSRAGGQWRMQSPLDAAADAAMVATLLGNLAGAVKHYSFPKSEAADLAEYGLDAPSIKIAIEGRTGGGGEAPGSGVLRTRLLVGKASAGQYYAMSPDGPDIFTIGGHIRNQINQDVFHFRDKSIARADPARVTGFSLANRHGTIEVEKRAGGDWMVTKPSTFRADRKCVESLLHNIDLSRIAQFEDHLTSSPQELGLDKPTLVLTVRLSGADKERQGRPEETCVLVGQRDGDGRNYAAVRGGDSRVIRVPESFVDDLMISFKDLRKHALFDFPVDKVVRLEALVGKSRAVFVKKEKGRWEFEDDPGTRVNQEKTRTLINGLCFLEAEGFITDAPAEEELAQYRLAPPMSEFRVQVEGETQSHDLLLGRAHEEVNAIYAMVRGTSSVVTIANSNPTQFFVTRQRYADYRLYPDIDSAELARIALALGPSKGELLRDAKGQWTLKRSAEGAWLEVEVRKVETLLRALQDLESLKTLTPDDEQVKKAGLDAPVVRVEVWREGAQSPLVRVDIGRNEGHGDALTIRSGDEYHLVYVEAADAVRGAVERILE